jgi:hypothetical protein
LRKDTHLRYRGALLTARFFMSNLLMEISDFAANASNAVRWTDNTPESFPRVEILAAPKSETADAPGPGDPDDDDESEGGVGNIDPEDDEGYDDGDDDDDDEEDTLWATAAGSSSPPNRA